MTHPDDDFDGERAGCGHVMLGAFIFYAILFGVFYLVLTR